MRYLDTGGRDIEETLARWFEHLKSTDITSLRVQTGFFSEDSLGLLAPILDHCKSNDFPTYVLIGSNEPGTLESSVVALAELMDLTRSNSKLGVVSFRSGYYHPKVYHLSRSDGSQVAFVGSANLTGPGLAQHVEAGIALDSVEGDPTEILDSISNAVDKWFEEKRDGLREITCTDDIQQLVDDGILAVTAPPRSTPASSPGASGSTKPRLSPLAALPKLPKSGATAAASGTASTPSSVSGSSTVPAAVTPITTAHAGGAPRKGYPAYLLFNPGATSPTAGASALSGATLPYGAAGLIIRLNKDSARHFAGKTGTANISIPVATVSTLCFGIFQGKASGKPIERPRAEFDLYLRYVGDTKNIKLDAPVTTGIMAYGISDEESGHGDIRMVVPARVLALAALITKAGLTAPSDGNFALLQWPNSSNPAFGLTFLDPTSKLYTNAENIYVAAEKTGQIVGKGACWLPASLIPAW